MLTSLLLAAAIAAPFPPEFDLDDSLFVVTLTCHFQPVRFTFEGRERVLIEDLGDAGEIVDGHEIPGEEHLGLALKMALADSFARDPAVVEGYVMFVLETDGMVSEFEVEATSGCLAILEFRAGDYTKRSEYLTEEAIPAGLVDFLRDMHRDAAAADEAAVPSSAAQSDR